ncbi:Type I restriction-modification system,DNA-methyltransferase subunit M [Staphylococcus aureus]|uniref:site-specific DNA-methyltransferase (adenine-specific) n=1 Tax=Staphylococcus aureus TaxID=1280 RepID=A0A2X2K4X6_STAAU|nr:Type I restriction-modification system,DNA-methyltransferase subunit M [Staphylococcus aureus]
MKKRTTLEAVIGLPANIFYGTSIPTCILVFKKMSPNKTTTYYLSMHPMILKKEKNQNHLSDAPSRTYYRHI